MSLTQEEIEHRREVTAALRALVERSVTGASSPAKAAEYVVNALTVHHPDLLAEAAVTFRGEVA